MAALVLMHIAIVAVTVFLYRHQAYLTAKTTILVVDDVPDNLALMYNLLKDDCKVKITNGGEKALKIAASDSPPDLIMSHELRTLLYVEDNPTNLMLVEQIIESRPNIRMLSAHEGNLGIELARAHLPD